MHLCCQKTGNFSKITESLWTTVFQWAVLEFAPLCNERTNSLMVHPYCIWTAILESLLKQPYFI